MLPFRGKVPTHLAHLGRQQQNPLRRRHSRNDGAIIHERKPVFVDYWERLRNREAYLRAQEIDDALGSGT